MSVQNPAPPNEPASEGVKADRDPTPWVVALVLFAGAFWLALSEIQQYQSGDSLIPVLMSLQEWTPFFWGQERLGMLGALLATPLNNPLNNLIFQSTLYAFAGLSVFFLLARSMTRNTAAWLGAGASGALIFLIALAPREQFRWFILHHEYALALALGVAALLLIDVAPCRVSDEDSPASAPKRARRMRITRRLAGGGLLLLAQWVNISLIFSLAPLLLVRGYLNQSASGDKMTSAWTLGLLVGTFLPNLLLARAQGPATYPLLSPLDWPSSWWALLRNTAHQTQALMLLLLMALVLGSATKLTSKDGRDAVTRALRRVAPLLAAGLGHWFCLGALRHVGEHGSDSRYLFPSLAYLVTALTLLSFELLADSRPRLATTTGRYLMLLALPVIGFNHGAPGPSNIRSVFESKWGAAASEVVDTECTHVVGRYETAWPTVFYANLLLHDRGESARTVWGLAARGQAARGDWWPLFPDRIRVAFVVGDDRRAIQQRAQQFGIGELALVHAGRKIEVYRPGKAPPP